ncbi:FecR family protein, partial [Parabacteroides distasonis]|uniref:FecR family protein n=2 Tax=Tannerellaceae TaxID=2005525 RepID=UPI00325A523E
KVQLENYVKKMGINYLSPSEKVTLNKLTGEMIISRAEVKNAKEWTNGGLFFDEMPLSDIVKELNRSYNVKIHIADEQLTHNRFYALFNRKEQTIYNVLDIITATNQVRYKVEGDSILLYAK